MSKWLTFCCDRLGQCFIMEEADDMSLITINIEEPENIIAIKKDIQSQFVYVSFHNEDEENEGEIESIKRENITIEEPRIESPISQNTATVTEYSENDSNLKIIKLDDGRMFITGLEDESYESIEPRLLDCEEDEEATITLHSDDCEKTSDPTYQIVQVVKDENEQIQMYYYNEPPMEYPDEKRYKCNQCDKAYGTLHHLTVHIRSHLPEKPYVCTNPACDKTFTTNYSLKAHLRTHTGEKPYGCMICFKPFRTAGDLHKHVRTHTGEKPFVCPIEGCGRSFTTGNIRKVHIRSHTGERPYICDYPNCGKAFSSLTNHKNHIRIHSGEKPYSCRFPGCNKRFTEYSSLYKHNVVHKTERPYECNYCDLKFKQDTGLNLHKRVKHKIVVASDGTEVLIDS